MVYGKIPAGDSVLGRYLWIPGLEEIPSIAEGDGSVEIVLSQRYFRQGCWCGGEVLRQDGVLPGTIQRVDYGNVQPSAIPVVVVVHEEERLAPAARDIHKRHLGYFRLSVFRSGPTGLIPRRLTSDLELTIPQISRPLLAQNPFEGGGKTLRCTFGLF